MNQPVTSISQPNKDNIGSLHDLLKAFALNKAEKNKIVIAV
jgi:hypothetical protein